MTQDGSALRSALGRGLQRIAVVYYSQDAQVVAGARRLFQAFKVPWQIHYACDPDHAWSLIEQGGKHLLIAECSIATYAGSLLEEVAERVPHLVRLALVPTLDERQAFLQAGWAHQALPQPCNAKMLLHEVRRSSDLASLLADSHLSGLLNNLHDLPSTGAGLDAVWRELRSAEPELRRLVAAIEREPSLVAQVLRLANSPLFSPAGTVASLKQAVVLLGLSRLRSLILYLSCFARVDDDTIAQLHLHAWTSHTQRITTLALAIAKAERANAVFREQVLLAGVLQDIGVLGLAAVEAERYCACFVPQAVLLREAEQAAFGVTHAEVGAFLLGLWHLPLPIIEAIRFHHRPSHDARPDFDVAAVLHCANALCEEHRGIGPGPDDDFLEVIDKAGRLDAWRALAAETC